ncbi:MAG TPA: hypothetical protein VL404_02955 [Candidatus Eisenbacteria bacterium]|nr:hypothetical protein [Candidatus Eisenbacteria bacterium]
MTSRLEKVLFGALVLLYLLPVWSFRFIPTQDGATHLDTASVMRQYDDPGRPELRRYFTRTAALDPYWTVNLLLMALLSVFPPLAAEKIVATLCVALFPLSMRYLAASVDRRNAWVSWLAFPFSMGFWFHLGFYNFCLSWALYAALLGFWLRRGDEPNVLKKWPLLPLSVLLYFTHPMTSVVFCLSLGVLTAWLTGVDVVSVRRGALSPAQAWKNFTARGPETLIPLSPFLVLLWDFLFKALHGANLRPPMPAGESLGLLAGFHNLTTFPGAEPQVMGLAFAGFIALIAGGVLQRRRAGRLRREDGFLLLLAVLLFLFFRMTPFQIVNKRMTIFLVIAVIAWAASLDYPAAAKRAAQLGVVLFSILLTAGFAAQYRNWNRQWEDCVSLAARLEPGRTLLFFSLSRLTPTEEDMQVRVSPMRHVGSYIAAEKKLVSLNNYEANEPFLPLQYRPEVNPYLYLGMNLDDDEPPVDLRQYPLADYILVWLANPDNRMRPTVQNLFAQIQRDYEFVGASPSTRAGLYRKKSGFGEGGTVPAISNGRP